MGSGGRNNTLILGWISIMNVRERITYNKGSLGSCAIPSPVPLHFSTQLCRGTLGRDVPSPWLAQASSPGLQYTTACAYSRDGTTLQLARVPAWGLQHCSTLLVAIRYWEFENGLHWIWRGFGVPESGREVYPCMHCHDHSQSQACDVERRGRTWWS